MLLYVENVFKLGCGIFRCVVKSTSTCISCNEPRDQNQQFIHQKRMDKIVQFYSQE
jgi:hypothetical protein